MRRRDLRGAVGLEHVMAQAPGYKKLMNWADAPIMPTPGAVGEIIKKIAEEEKISVVGVDIGGAATFLEFAAESDIQLFI